MRKKLNISFIVILFLLFVSIFNFNISFAKTQQTLQQDGGGKKVDYSTSVNPNDYKPDNISKSDVSEVSGKVGVVLAAIRNISMVVSVIVLMIIGLKYILGSAEEKANYKATILPYIIGCVFAVTGTTIVDFIYRAVH